MLNTESIVVLSSQEIGDSSSKANSASYIGWTKVQMHKRYLSQQEERS